MVVIAAVTIAIERGADLVRLRAQTCRDGRCGVGIRVTWPKGPSRSCSDTPPGSFARGRWSAPRRKRGWIAWRSTTCRSFVLHGAVPIALGRARCGWTSRSGARSTRSWTPRRSDPAGPARLPDLRRKGWNQARGRGRAPHRPPLDPSIEGIYAPSSRGPGRSGAHLRNVTVFADAEVDRSRAGPAPRPGCGARCDVAAAAEGAFVTRA